ncbi:galactose/methyl galactoside ABC transporter permease MglC [Clostridium vitabionis]|uniref:galactose/methyl galactoside ABC transporter permease MglC n=1 Tax=Clostridium vitabionis TaxID=2784388 RepID=UPI00188C4815|nr:galactoside ABC transporter permease [Clostridium vitabionis]
MAEQILTTEEMDALLKPIDEHVGAIQKKIDELRRDGSSQAAILQNDIERIKKDALLTKEEKDQEIGKISADLAKARAVEAKNKGEIDKLIGEAEAYLDQHYNKEYFDKVRASCAAEKIRAKQKYDEKVAGLKKENEKNLASLKDPQEIKDEKYVYKNRLFDAKMAYDKEISDIKTKEHEAFTHEYHLIDLLRNSRFTWKQARAQKKENRKFTFNRRTFLLQNGLYIVILIIFAMLCVITPVVKGGQQLLTPTNILNILQQASPRMFFALGVAGLILLTGTDLSIGRIVGMCMTTSTIIMHQGKNTGAVFGKVFDFTGLPLGVRVIMALVICIILCVLFTSLAGFFMARFKMHPFISTMSNMLIIFGLVTYATKGVSFGAIEPAIPKMIIPKLNGFPTIILWAVVAICVVWFIWNKTTFGKNLYAVGGNPEAATVSGISVFWVTVGAFAMAGVLYACGAWLECMRMVGSGSAAYGQGWDMDAIAACVVGGVSFTGGIGKISGVVVGVLIFTALTYSLTILGIDTNLQFVFEGIIILTAVTLDCLKYVQKK